MDRHLNTFLESIQENKLDKLSLFPTNPKKITEKDIIKTVPPHKIWTSYADVGNLFQLLRFDIGSWRNPFILFVNVYRKEVDADELCPLFLVYDAWDAEKKKEVRRNPRWMTKTLATRKGIMGTSVGFAEDRAALLKPYCNPLEDGEKIEIPPYTQTFYRISAKQGTYNKREQRLEY